MCALSIDRSTRQIKIRYKKIKKNTREYSTLENYLLKIAASARRAAAAGGWAEGEAGSSLTGGWAEGEAGSSLI